VLVDLFRRESFGLKKFGDGLAYAISCVVGVDDFEGVTDPTFGGQTSCVDARYELERGLYVSE
jgi:hypothetical protein